MGQPTPSVFVDAKGRRGSIMFQCAWSSADADNLSDYLLFDRSQSLSGDYTDARIAIEGIEWQASPGVSAEIYFSSFPPNADSLVFNIPLGSTQGEEMFEDLPNSAVVDPNKSAPNDVRITTSSAAAGDDMFIRLRYREKGTRPVL